jgi:hypothetical protein
MTEGIIQKVFNEYLNTEKLSFVSFYDKFIKQTLKDVQQELIAEIKKVIAEQLPASSAFQIRDILIGDTE